MELVMRNLCICLNNFFILAYVFFGNPQVISKKESIQN